MNISLRQLEYFVAVAERLSFRAAAEACFVTQPGLSIQLKELEGQLDVQLFERSRRRVLITPEGETLLPLARSILTQAGELVDTARSLTRPLSATLRLGVIPTVAPYLLPKALPAIRRRYPELRILLHEDFTHRLLALLGDGKLDLLLLALEADLGDVATLPLGADPFVVAVPEGHRFAARKRLTEADLAGEQVLLLDDGHCLRDAGPGGMSDRRCRRGRRLPCRQPQHAGADGGGRHRHHPAAADRPRGGMPRSLVHRHPALPQTRAQPHHRPRLANEVTA